MILKYALMKIVGGYRNANNKNLSQQIVCNVLVFSTSVDDFIQFDFGIKHNNLLQNIGKINHHETNSKQHSVKY